MLNNFILILDNYFRNRDFTWRKFMKAIILILALSFSFSTFAGVKVGLVNIQRIMSKIKEGKSIDKTLKKSFDSKQKLLKKDESSIKKLQEKFQKQSKVLSETAKAKKFAEIQQKMTEARKRAAGFQKEIQKQEAELKKPLLEKLRKVIDSVSKAEGVDMTFEISASPVVYAANKVDLSDKVIKAYDKKHK